MGGSDEWTKERESDVGGSLEAVGGEDTLRFTTSIHATS